MGRFADIDFSLLPAPEAVDPLDYETIYEARKATFLQLWELRRAADPSLPEFDTLDLDTDPVAVVLQESAYQSLLLRQEVNDQAKAVMLPYAVDADLDVLGARFGVERLDDETDERLRRRIQLAPEALSTAGTRGGYIFHALTAAPTLYDATATQIHRNRVRVSLMGSTETRTPSDEEISAVAARVLADDVRPLTDDVEIAAVKVVPVRISAVIEMPRGFGGPTAETAAEVALNAWLEQAAGLGRPLSRSGILSVLHIANAITVDLRLPAEDVVVGDDACWRVTEIHVSTKTA